MYATGLTLWSLCLFVINDDSLNPMMLQDDSIVVTNGTMAVLKVIQILPEHLLDAIHLL